MEGKPKEVAYFFISLLIYGDVILIFCDFVLQIVNTYTEAVSKVDPKLACGKLHTLWVSFAKFYESHKQVHDVIII